MEWVCMDAVVACRRQVLPQSLQRLKVRTMMRWVCMAVVVHRRRQVLPKSGSRPCKSRALSLLQHLRHLTSTCCTSSIGACGGGGLGVRLPAQTQLAPVIA